MAILLTNGTSFISLNKHGGVMKVHDINQAKVFKSVEKAMEQINKAPGKCRNYYYIEMDDKQIVVGNNTQSKRKKFSSSDRAKIYKKTEGHCYLCGDFVDFDSFEIEHMIPISKGGTNDLSNLFCSCHTCNTIKQDIYPEDFMERISKIFMYQMESKSKNKFRWRILHRELKRMIQK